MRAMNPRINSLDWLRALAVTAVVVGHSNGAYAPGGAVGVSVFFVLSGYLIADILLRDGALTLPNIGGFIARRIGRIYPMFAVHIAAVSVFLWIAQPESFARFSTYAAGVLTFQSPPREWAGYGVAVLWTLYVEAWFYLTFPFLLLTTSTIPGNRMQKLLLVFGTLIVVVNYIKLAGYREVSVVYYDLFLIGSTCAVIVRSCAIPRIFARPGMMLLGLVIISAAIVKAYPGDRNMEWHLQSMAAALGTAVVILNSFADPPRYRLELVAFIGRISYSMYLVHALALDIAIIYFRPLGYAWLPYLAIVTYVSWITYTYIEQPFIRIVHRLVPLESRSDAYGATP